MKNKNNLIAVLLVIIILAIMSFACINYGPVSLYQQNKYFTEDIQGVCVDLDSKVVTKTKRVTENGKKRIRTYKETEYTAKVEYDLNGSTKTIVLHQNIPEGNLVDLRLNPDTNEVREKVTPISAIIFGLIGGVIGVADIGFAVLVFSKDKKNKIESSSVNLDKNIIINGEKE